MIDLDSCSHVFEDNSCVICGLILSYPLEVKGEYNRNYPSINTSKTSVLDKLSGIPEDVISKARQNISRKGEETGKKVRDDHKNTFIEIYEAYFECGYRDFDPNLLALKLGLGRKDINCCLKNSSGTSLIPSIHDDCNKYTSIVIISPTTYIDDLCKVNKLEKFSEELKILTNCILEKKDILYSSKPKYVACAIAKKFCESKKINTKSFSKLNQISDNALKNQ